MMLLKLNKYSIVQNIPNLLSVFRLVLIIFILHYLFRDTVLDSVIAMVLYLFGILTDFLDGYIARKYNCVTGLGKVLDATVDKVFFFSILGSLIFLEVYSLKLLWFFILIHVVRDVLVTGFRRKLSKNGFYLGASHMGKIKTVFQFLFLFIGLGIVYLNRTLCLSEIIIFIQLFSYIIYIVSVLLSISSGLNYFKLYQEKQDEFKS